MPELPEVETIKRDLEKHLVGKKIQRISFCDVPKLLQPNPDAVAEAVKGQTIEKFSRIGKLLFIHLSNKNILGAHFKMSGRFLLRSKKDHPDRFVHVVFDIEGDQELRFAEMRKFGYIKLINGDQNHALVLSKYGPEPLSTSFTAEALRQVFKKTARPVKVVIMDQTQVAGIGNIYADESLWCAKIHPQRKANDLSLEEIKTLHKCIEEAIEQGIEDRGTSVDLYVDAFGVKGSHSSNLKVFKQDGLPCPRDGTIIKKTRVGGRGTHFCPNCQRQ